MLANAHSGEKNIYMKYVCKEFRKKFYGLILCNVWIKSPPMLGDILWEHDIDALYDFHLIFKSVSVECGFDKNPYLIKFV